MIRRWVIAVALGLVMSAGAEAQEQQRHPYAGQIEDAEQRADRTQAMAISWEDYQRWGDFVKADLELAKRAAMDESGAWRQVAEAYKRQDKEAIEQTLAKARELERATRLWAQRLEARSSQAQFAVHELNMYWNGLLRGDAMAEEASAAIEARRAVCDAWGEYAEALVPDTPQERLHELWDRIAAARVEYELAEWRFNWSNELYAFQQEPRAAGAELDAKFAEFWRLFDETVRVRREQAALEQRRRELERMKATLMPQIRQTYEGNIKAYQEAEQRAREEAERQAKEEAERKAKAEAEKAAKASGNPGN